MKFQLIFLLFLVLFLAKETRACPEAAGGGLLAALSGGGDQQGGGGEDAQKGQRGILKGELNCIEVQ